MQVLHTGSMHTGAGAGAQHVGAGAGQVLQDIALLNVGAQTATKRAKVVKAFIFFLLY